MNKPRTYNELLAEKARLKLLLAEQKEIIHQDFNEIKTELEPVRRIFTQAKKLFSKDAGGGLLTLGTDKLIDLLVRRVLLAKSGWLAKLVVPLLAKNYTSHIVDDNKGKIMNWIFSLFKRKNKNPGEEEQQ